jgi:2-oxo-3-(phosphooxy)propyl 3-oxoalkanoate synthase
MSTRILRVPPQLPDAAPVRADARHGLDFNLRVPRELVHRAHDSEVFLAGGFRTEQNRVYIAGQWPSTHLLHHPDAHGMSDPLLLVETARQAAIYLAHRFYAVPPGRRFIFCDLEMSITDRSALLATGADLDVELDCRVTVDPRPSSRRFGARVQAEVEVAGRSCATIAVRLLAVDEAGYAALRRRPRELPEPGGFVAPANLLAPSQVGRFWPRNVLLAPQEPTATGSYWMHLDPAHPGFFEHASDHIPGVALAEAFRQAAHHTVHHAVVGAEGSAPGYQLEFLTVTFERFGELPIPPTVSLDRPVGERPGGRSLLVLTAAQEDRVLARARVLYQVGGRV